MGVHGLSHGGGDYNIYEEMQDITSIWQHCRYHADRTYIIKTFKIKTNVLWAYIDLPGGGGWLQYIRRNEGFFFNQVSSIADIIHIVCIKKKDEGVYIF